MHKSMKRMIAALLAAALCTALLCSCSRAAQNSEAAQSSPTAQTNAETHPNTTAATSPADTQAASAGETETTPMQTIEIIAGGQTFTAALNGSKAAQALAAKLPLTITMQELHGNEKYHYFSDTLPADAQRVGTIRAGDLMLYGSDCLVLFYQTFSTAYTYTPLGSITDPSGLAEALGSGRVQVTFRAAEG